MNNKIVYLFKIKLFKTFESIEFLHYNRKSMFL